MCSGSRAAAGLARTSPYLMLCRGGTWSSGSHTGSTSGPHSPHPPCTPADQHKVGFSSQKSSSRSHTVIQHQFQLCTSPKPPSSRRLKILEGVIVPAVSMATVTDSNQVKFKLKWQNPQLISSLQQICSPNKLMKMFFVKPCESQMSELHLC